MNLKEYLGKSIKVLIDRPLGSSHPKHGFVYDVNYGYVPGTKASDGEGIDAYLLGINTPVEEYTGKCIAIIHRYDDDDDKLVIIPKDAVSLTDQEIRDLVNFQEKYFKSEIIRE